jgi:23S rRNA (cytidine1920-2'-O)/16S rRNA (cytidine1409-2'-O)-methyltransferase
VAKGQRLDQLILDRGLLPTREVARTAIMDGAVLVNGQKMTKPGMSVPDSAVVELLAGFAQPKFASRGGLKLEKALDFFNISAENRICLDIGASTGGFTDCLLKRGAAKVYAVDVGYGQLDWALRSDARVIVRERLNARSMKAVDLYDDAAPDVSLVVMDVSFISITKILPVLANVTTNDENLDVVCLVKPQFEAGRNAVGKGGVVKSAETHVQVLQYVCDFAASVNLQAVALTYSPVKGPAGNIEFLAHFRRESASAEFDYDCLVKDAHESLSSS